MGYLDADYYYNPETFGLEVVASVDWLADEGSYEFHDTVVWYHKASGVYFYATDSGCSCYSPFETFTAPDLSEMEGSGSAIEVANHLSDEAKNEPSNEVTSEVADAIAAIMRHRSNVRDND